MEMSTTEQTSVTKCHIDPGRVNFPLSPQWKDNIVLDHVVRPRAAALSRWVEKKDKSDVCGLVLVIPVTSYDSFSFT